MNESGDTFSQNHFEGLKELQFQDKNQERIVNQDKIVEAAKCKEHRGGVGIKNPAYPNHHYKTSLLS